MAENTSIPWCDHTFNVAWGCWKISPGCENCYADAWDARFGGDHWGRSSPRRLFGEKHWTEPLKWNRGAEAESRRHRVFCSSMTDVFLDDEAVKGELPKLWALIRETPWLDWQLLTKRPERIAESLPSDWGSGYPNVWLGVSAESQKYADIRQPILCEIPAAIRWLSVEPMLESIDFEGDMGGIDWVVCGGESGAKARPFEWAWAESLRDQCDDADVAFFMKQFGSNAWCEGCEGRFPMSFKDSKGGDPSEWPADLRIREFPIVAGTLAREGCR